MTIAVLAFAIALLITVLFSRTIRHTALSASVIFLVAGFLLGAGVLNLVDIRADDAFVSHFVKVTLFGVLFADGMQIDAKDLLKAWKFPGRALLLGLPLTLLIMAVFAHLMMERILK